MAHEIFFADSVFAYDMPFHSMVAGKRQGTLVTLKRSLKSVRLSNVKVKTLFLGEIFGTFLT